MPESATRQLPRGRHGLPREAVVAAQRDRILLAMAEAMTENGYVGTPVAAVIKRAGVSRETFYEQFRSKEDCFEAAYERAAELMLTGILTATGAEFDGETGAERIERLLGSYLDALAGQPAYARLFLVEVYAVGSEAIDRRTQMQETFVAMVADVLGADTAEQRFACQTRVAALSAMVTARIAVGDLDGLRELREPLLDLVRRSGELFGSTVVED
ncbi:TetR/AcrR family transcriptional regulator [Nocardia seriolae]|uniref:Transcriptional regulator n=1 Tax=Nocardia seriolae TaxID=37332 RepID=A0A0B8N6J0_9NOCA|nr:TetR/AcrR family transcriptional regulator [Nocardia seriolae]MTJ60072.1 TetR family transcriptional regulator [Nocardia seriolae]MTJ70142.1 TetR family transcriptional regulator [Nocardia seriolae]MTJ85074.1 TetR family transcriptional regulator [Nocardia seriolae]MTK29069.1 TetR family transcriptional regulator [Nocardia seriolae]MTK38001.1 TetR family transcriptional regulator [Nocardia seriolae]